MIILFLKRIKFFLHKIIIKFLRTHRHLNVINNGVGGYTKYVGRGKDNKMIISKGCCLENPCIHIFGNNNVLVFEEGCYVGSYCSFWMEGNNIRINIGARTTFTEFNHVNAQEDGTLLR